ncbi:MAG: flagellar protein FlaG [Firmicutes bacterium]|nr:flagellar protein FlaG [Bacillota bacterium]
MKVDGIDPLQLNKIHEQTQKAVVQESHRQDPRQKQQDKVLGREQRVVEWERSYMEDLQDAVEKVNITADTFNISLRFRIHEESERIMVQVVNLENNEVIKEIPPEKILNVVAQIQNIIGLFVDTRR